MRGFRQMVAEYSRLDPIPTLEVLGRHKQIRVGALKTIIAWLEMSLGERSHQGPAS
jgi:hypothetical protein